MLSETPERNDEQKSHFGTSSAFLGHKIHIKYVAVANFDVDC